MNEPNPIRPQATAGIWRRFLVLIPLAIVLTVVSYLYIGSVNATYHAWTPVYRMDEDFSVFTLADVTMDTPGVVEAVAVDYGINGAACVTLHAIADGETTVLLGNDSLNTEWYIRVVNGGIIEGLVEFEGWESIHISYCIFLAVASLLFASVLVRLLRSSWYGYEMVACGGVLLFALFQVALFAFLLLHGSLQNYSDMAYALIFMVDFFVMLSLVPMGILVFLVSLSNISLIRHEGLRPVNLLGVGVGVAWAIGVYVWMRLSNIAVGPEWLYNVWRVANSVVVVAIAYGECLLLSTIICAWRASRHVPLHGVDYLIVLGCGIRKDGTPSPLLAGRVDKALAFDAARSEAGDAPARFVPSGGQGADEVTSEAQSMRAYLMDKGIAPERVVLEDRSTTTRENMIFSREAIEKDAEHSTDGLRIAFSTTNYHVFRGYVCAHEAGMAVEGMGAKTKAYFWPNAFLREFIGLLAAQWKAIILTYFLLAIVYIVAGYLLIA